jgi:hypothetical protein
VIEIGAGHGSLSFLLSRELCSREYSTFVLATDFHDKIFRDLVEIEWIKRLCALGKLDYAVCKATSESILGSKFELTLLYSGKKIADLGPFDSIVIIGNYAFDSFPVDVIISHPDGRVQGVGYQSREESASRTKYGYSCTELCSRCFKPLVNCACEGITSKSVHHDQLCSCDLCWNRALNELVTSSSGAHIVPTAARNILLGIRDCINLNPNRGIKNRPSFSLILGDCFLDENAEEWQLSLYKTAIDSTEFSGTGAVCYMPGLDLPLLSPIKDALAVPVTRGCILSLFKNVFGPFEGIHLDVTIKNLQSSFDVLVLHTSTDIIAHTSRKRPHSIDRSDCECISTSADTKSSFVGPNDLIVVMQMLQESRIDKECKTCTAGTFDNYICNVLCI